MFLTLLRMGVSKFATLTILFVLLLMPSTLGYIITGTVFGENDRVVSDAVVAIHFYKTHGLLRETRTNDQGIFRFEIPSRENTYYVRVEHPDFQVFEGPYFFTMYEQVRKIDLNVYLAPPTPPQIEFHKGRMRIFADAFPKQVPSPFVGVGIIGVAGILGLLLRRLT